VVHGSCTLMSAYGHHAQRHGAGRGGPGDVQGGSGLLRAAAWVQHPTTGDGHVSRPPAKAGRCRRHRAASSAPVAAPTRNGAPVRQTA